MSRAERDRRYRDANRKKIYAQNAAWKQKNPGYGRTYDLMARYGIDQAQYESLLLSQGGVCAICRTDKPGKRLRFFPVDHDHATGKVRGLLCDRCNRGLGFFDDSLENVRAALSYLEAACQR